jgi:hypothetical protein
LIPFVLLLCFSRVSQQGPHEWHLLLCLVHYTCDVHRKKGLLCNILRIHSHCWLESQELLIHNVFHADYSSISNGIHCRLVLTSSASSMPVKCIHNDRKIGMTEKKSTLIGKRLVVLFVTTCTADGIHKGRNVHPFALDVLTDILCALK